MKIIIIHLKIGDTTMKKFLIYYNEEKNVIGVREHSFNWEEGEDILTNGITTTIFAIFDGTTKNIKIAKTMMETLRRYNNYHKTSLVEHNGQLALLTKSKVWKSFDAKLDYVEMMVNQMN